MNHRKLIERLKKMKRVEMLHMTRLDDDTAAYYCDEKDEIILFIDVVVSDAMVHWNAWGVKVDNLLEDFLVKFIGTRTPLHELFHYCGVESSIQAEYLAIKFAWDNDKVGKVVSGWEYPKLPVYTVAEIEIKE